MPRTFAAFAVAAAALGACQSSGPAPTGGAVRQTAGTAPADLQLLCASAASTQFGLAADTVLPTSSTAIAEGYQVALTFTGGAATCVVTAEGTVVSVTRA